MDNVLKFVQNRLWAESSSLATALRLGNLGRPRASNIEMGSRITNMATSSIDSTLKRTVNVSCYLDLLF